MIPFADKYLSACSTTSRRPRSRAVRRPPFPSPADLKPVARARGPGPRDHPAADPRAGRAVRPDLDGRGRASPASAAAASSPRSSSTPRPSLYEPVELTDILGTRFLVRKIEDVPPHSAPRRDPLRGGPGLEAGQGPSPRREGRRGPRRAAQGQGRDVKDPKRRRLPRRHRSRRSRGSQTSFLPDLDVRAQPRRSRPRSRRSLTPGEAFRDAYFGLQKGAVEVAPNQPKTVYYVLTLDRREPGRASRPSTPPTATSSATRTWPGNRPPGSRNSSGWAGSASRPASRPTGCLPTRPNATTRPGGIPGPDRRGPPGVTVPGVSFGCYAAAWQ